MSPLLERHVPAWEMKEALAKRHAKDSFFTEVKNGPTHWASDLLIMDAVAIKKSWASPRIIGYEIKSSRSDFLADEKWRGYLPYCNEFLFVCPRGIIDPSELPEEIGLIYYNWEKKSLWTSRRGTYKDIDQPVDMYRYLLMRWDNQKYPFFNSRKEYYEAYVQDKADKTRLGGKVKSKMAQDVVDLAKKVEELEVKLQFSSNNRNLTHAKRLLLEKLGVQDMSDHEFWKTVDTLITEGQMFDLNWELRSIERALEQIKEKLGSE